MFYRLGIRAVGVETICAEAGATKMSLYRSYPSKDELVAAYLRDRNGKYWEWWDKTVAAHPKDARAQLVAVFESIASKTTRGDYRGCPFTNAAIEFPEPDHPGRAVAAENKRDLRERLRGSPSRRAHAMRRRWPMACCCWPKAPTRSARRWAQRPGEAPGALR